MLLNSFFHFTFIVFHFFPLFPKTTRTLSDDNPKLSTNRNAPRTMGTQGATNAASLHEGDYFSAKTLGKSLLLCQNLYLDWLATAIISTEVWLVE